jgi:basic membrane lipoprotein Med (substrate-binding protein (PBP1-ABC) superfamily)/DNA-binding SARP family transcriptional activator
MNRVVSTERILDELWPQDPLGKEKTLWVYISRLRSALEPDREAHARSSVLLTGDHGYKLVVDPDQVDSCRFEHEAARGRALVRDDPDTAADLLGHALALWRGAAYQDFEYDEFARDEMARLEEGRLLATEDLLDAKLRAGQHREAVGDLEKLVRNHPLRERPIGLLMLALYRSGRQAEALRAFQNHRRVLGEELGVEPSAELSRIEEQVLLHDERLDPGGKPHLDAVTKNPFKGLQAFGEGDAAVFFGRDRLVAEIVRRLSLGTPLLSLIGSSGSGKSSVLRAGLIPALRKGAVGDPESWRIAIMVPGARPTAELEAALLRSSLDAPEGLAGQLDREDGLLRAALRIVPHESGRLLLVIDQFEELFTLVTSDEARRRFIRNLEVALEDPHRRVVVIIALRADFYERLLDFPEFGQMLGTGIVNAVSLLPDELEVAAEQPAAVAGAHLEPKLLARLLTDVAGQTGALPLFQFTLTELFDRRSGTALTFGAYEKMGGVGGAITGRAEELYQTFDGGQRAAAKQLFLRLVTINDTGAWSRRRVAASEIVNLAVDTVDLQTVLDGFGRYRLLTFDRDPVTGSSIVEVAHEALLREWFRLKRWIEEGRDDVLRHALLSTAIAEWTESGRGEGYLLFGQRLSGYEQWAEQSTLTLSTGEAEYLEASIAYRERTKEAEAIRVARETRLDRQARLRLVSLAVATLLLVIVLAGGLIVALGGGPRIVLVHGVTDDHAVNDLILAGVAAAEREHELTIERVEPLIDAEADLRQVAETGADMVIISSVFDSMVERVARDYPDVHFVAIDPALVKEEHPNVTEVHFAVADSAFLAGVAAALKSNSGIVGFIGGFPTLQVEQSRSGFEQGATFQNPDITVLSRYLGPVENPGWTATRSPDLAQALAARLFEEGADVIFYDAGESGQGVVDAAREYDADSRWVIGSNVDAYLTAASGLDRQYILTSTIKRFDMGVERAVAAFLDGSLQAGETEMGFDEQAVGLSEEGGYLDSDSDYLDNLAGEVALGHLTVHDFSLNSSGWQFEPDMTVHIAIGERSCTPEVVEGGEIAGGKLRLAPGRRIAFEVENRADQPVGGGIYMVPAGTTLEALGGEARADLLPTSYGEVLAGSFIEPTGRATLAAVMPRAPIAISCLFRVPFGSEPPSELPLSFAALIVTPGET